VVLTVLAPLGGEVVSLLNEPGDAENLDWAWLAFTGTSVEKTFRANLAIALAVVKNGPNITAFLLALTGYFLLGVCAGRLQVFGKSLQFRKYFKKGFWLSLVLGVGAGVAAFAMLWLKNRAYVPATVYTDFLVACLFRLNKIAMFVFHACTIVCAYHHPYVRRIAGWLVFPGRMTLTNYVMQSVSRYKVGPLEQLWRNLTQTEGQRPLDVTGSRQAA